MEKKEKKKKRRESKGIGGGKSRVRSRGLVSFLEGMNGGNDFVHVHARDLK